MDKNISRRKFISSAATASVAFSIVPRNVLGGTGFVAPSDKLTIAYIGCGTQGMREMAELITNPKIQITSVCDPNKESTDYHDWSIDGIKKSIRKVLEDESWGQKYDGVPGGRDVGQDFVNRYYAKQKDAKYKGCNSYIDFRELLEKEKDVDALKVMTPDHLHGTISIAGLKKGKQVVIHKPIANRMYETRLTIDTARKTGVGTHLLAWSQRSGMEVVKKWIADGAIGTLKEIHNWSNRPVWPQWTANPTDTPPIPQGLNWDLWLGPVPDRPYHPNYTNMVFRGWYDFGGGSIADMGHYSLFPLFVNLGIGTPAYSAEAYGTTTSEVVNHVAHGVKNDVAFPASCMVRFKFAKQETLPAFELFWYDGGMKPVTPEEVEADGKELGREGMMFVGDKGKILAGFRCESPQLIPDAKMKSYMDGKELPKEVNDSSADIWIDAFKAKKQSAGSFLLAGPVSETINLGAVALRAKKRLLYDTTTMQITNLPEANKYLVREYRKGWEL